MLNAIKRFSRQESAASLVFLVMLVLAVIAVNTSLKPYYDAIRTPGVTVIINEGLMALFFLCVGIEIKQEIKKDGAEGLSRLRLPLVAAIAGIAVPALIYFCANRDTGHMRGWAIPTATDIAFSLGILSLFAKRVPPSLRVFLMSIAIFDDLVAIAIIAVFYTQDIQWVSFSLACGCVALLMVYNRYIKRMTPFVFAGCALWVALFDCGISPTIAGALLGILMPLEMGQRALRFLHIPVAFIVVPIFVFANSGVPLSMLSYHIVANPVSLGIAGGLFLGKQWGIFTASLIMVKAGWARLPEKVTWLQLYAVSVLCGVGFTMSLFIGSLAFNSEPLMLFSKAGVFTGSLASAVIGIICMALSQNRNKAEV